MKQLGMWLPVIFVAGVLVIFVPQPAQSVRRTSPPSLSGACFTKRGRPTERG